MLFYNIVSGNGLLGIWHFVNDIVAVFLTGCSLMCWSNDKVMMIMVLLAYGYWYFRLFLVVQDLGVVLMAVPMPSDSYVSLQRQSRWQRRHRRRKPPFYRRSKFARVSVVCPPFSQSEGDGLLDETPLFNLGYWHNLHFVGDEYGREFDRYCALNADFVELFGVEERFNISCSAASNVDSFVFVANDMMIDLTKISDSGNVMRFQSVYHAGIDGPPIVFDTGASVSITPDREDFISFTDDVSTTTLTGITSSAVCKGKGKIRLNLRDDTGQSREVVTTALYVPAARVKLLSVQRYCREVKDGATFVVNEDGCCFTFPTSQGGKTITFDLENGKMLPQTSVLKQWGRKMVNKNTNDSIFTVVSSDNLNLDPAQKMLLEWHWKLGHYNMNWIRYLIRSQVLPVRGQKSSIAKCFCTACQLGKQSRRPEGTVNHKIRKEKDGGLKKNMTAVGGRVSTDQFVSSLPGRLPTSYGREKEHEQYTGGTVFIDEASEYIHVENQVSLGASETIRSKQRFEKNALRHGVSIKGYRGDNGVYKSEAFQQSCQSMNQTLDFSGIGAHHHNGIAERGIRTISTCARTILLHAMLHWPEETALNLWPFAVDYAVYLWNRMPREKSGLSPMEIFYSVKSDHEELRSAKVWGCPVYVLEPTLQDGKKLPRWQPRSKLGQFLGRSKVHASSVGLIRNLKTGKISSQFHVVYDDHFTTLSVNKRPGDVAIPTEWVNLFKYSREKHYDDADVETSYKTPGRNTAPPTTYELPPLPDMNPRQPSEGDNPVDTPLDSSDPLRGSSKPAPQAVPAPSPAAPPTQRQSRRLANLAPEYVGLHTLSLDDDYLCFLEDFHQISEHDAFLVGSDLNTSSTPLTRHYDLLHLLSCDDDDELLQNGTHPLAFAARANAEDNPNLEEALASCDREGFIQAMHLELEQLESMDAWEIVPRDYALKTNRRILDVLWVFKRKRYPDGSVKKLKARLVVRGDQQIEGVDYDNSFSPVVQWSTIRLLLILSVMLQLHTVQVDYTLAFVQAPAQNNTFVEMPKMFEVPGMIFQLKRNLYGLCEAPRNFFYHLKKGLNERGLVNSKHDHCLFYNDEVMVMCYVDDCIFLAKDASQIDKLIDDLRDPVNADHSKFLLNKEEDYAGFLGIDISASKTVEGALELLQTGLIDRILKVLCLTDDNTKVRHEPAASVPLGKHEDAPPRKESWSYSSVVGMMLYLASNSRPDIAFAVNQCARFTHYANNQHEIAIKRIGRYLKATKNSGLLMKPTQALELAMYADADFAGLWNVENKDDSVSVKSRTGYIITLGEVPITWSSKLQTEIATSTMHAEYIALSTGMRELLPVKNLLEEICSVLEIKRNEDVKVVKAYEDNEGALKLATSPLAKTTPQSKHFAVKYHWFREKLEENNIEILRVGTDLQKADIFTKGLIGPEFRAKRKMLMGW